MHNLVITARDWRRGGWGVLVVVMVVVLVLMVLIGRTELS